MLEGGFQFFLGEQFGTDRFGLWLSVVPGGDFDGGVDIIRTVDNVPSEGKLLNRRSGVGLGYVQVDGGGGTLKSELLFDFKNARRQFVGFQPHQKFTHTGFPRGN